MAVEQAKDVLGTAESQGFSTGWSWKDTYATSLAEDGYERFAQYSVTPDTTMLYAGPARFTAIDPTVLTPIGLSDNVSMQSNPQLAQLFELGSNRSFFTRGKTINQLSMSKMLADQKNILAALSQNAYRPASMATANSATGSSAPGPEAPNPNVMLNLDSEYFDVPFGMLLLMKTRGGGSEGSGKPIAALYLEYCMFGSHQFNIASSTPVVMENISLQFDRVVPVSISA